MTNGYVYAHRTAWHHPAFNDLREAAIWNYLYQNAAWRDCQVNFNKTTFNIKRGQIVTTPRFLAKGFGISEKGARVVIQKLKKLEMVAIRGTTKGTIVTICNYEKYQSKEKTEGEQQGNQRANRGRTEDANKKELNKDNKEKKDVKIPAGYDDSWGEGKFAKANGGLKITSDWEISQNWYDMGINKGLEHDAILAKAEKFKNHYLGANAKRKVYKDWDQVWRDTWLSR